MDYLIRTDKNSVYFLGILYQFRYMDKSLHRLLFQAIPILMRKVFDKRKNPISYKGEIRNAVYQSQKDEAIPLT